MQSGPFFHFKLSKTAHRKQPKSLKARFLLKTIEIADYRWKPDYAFNPECIKSLSELDMMCKDTELVISGFYSQPTKTLAAAILLYNQNLPQLLETLLSEIPSYKLPLYEPISKIREKQTPLHIPPVALAMEAYAPTRKTLSTLYTSIPLKVLVPSDIDAENFDLIFNLALTLLSDKIYEPMDSFLSNSNAQKIMQQRMAEDPEKLLYFLSKAIEAQKHKYENLFDVLVNLGLIKHINDKIRTVNRANFQSVLFDFASIAAIRGFPEVLELFLTTPGPFFGIEGIHTISPLKLATLASKDFTLSPFIQNACSEVLQAQKRSDLLKVDLRLFMSIMASDPAMLKQTLAKSPNLEAILNQSIEGLTPLYLAVMTNKVHIAEMLLEAGADVNAQCDGHSPLHTAVRENNPSMVRLLLEKKANINAMDSNGETPLKICLNNIQNGVGRNAKCETLTRSKQILKILLAHKPDLSLCKASRKLQFLRNSVFHPMVNSAVVEMNQDFKKFSTSVKGLPFPYEIIGKIMSFVVEYKSETELTNDATHILSKWHLDRSSSPSGIKKRNSREEEAGRPKRRKV